MADGTRTHDDRNHNLSHQALRGAALRAIDGNTRSPKTTKTLVFFVGYSHEFEGLPSSRGGGYSNPSNLAQPCGFLANAGKKLANRSVHSNLADEELARQRAYWRVWLGMLALHPHAGMGVLIAHSKAQPCAVPTDRFGDLVRRQGQRRRFESRRHNEHCIYIQWARQLLNGRGVLLTCLHVPPLTERKEVLHGSISVCPDPSRPLSRVTVSHRGELERSGRKDHHNWSPLREGERPALARASEYGLTGAWLALVLSYVTVAGYRDDWSACRVRLSSALLSDATG